MRLARWWPIPLLVGVVGAAGRRARRRDVRAARLVGSCATTLREARDRARGAAARGRRAARLEADALGVGRPSRSSARSASGCGFAQPGETLVRLPAPETRKPSVSLTNRARVGEARAREAGARRRARRAAPRRCSTRRATPAPLPEFTLEIPRQKEHGDFACNAALLLAKRLRHPPREIAEQLAARLRARRRLVARAEVAGPGFVNLWLAGSRWQELLRRVLAEGARYGRVDDAARAQRVQVEFVSANPTGPLTLGHGRQAVLGDAIARLLEAPGLRRHARVLLQQRRAPDARARRVGARALPRAARPRRAAAGGRARRPGAPLGRVARRPAGRVPEGRLPGRLHRRARRGAAARSTARRSSTSPATACSARPPRRTSSPRSARRSTRSASTSTSTRTRRISTSGGQLERRARRSARAGPRLRAGRRDLVARDRARARARPRGREAHRRGRPTCCPTSPITARSSAAASTT